MNQNQVTQLKGAVSARPETQVENEIGNLGNAHKELLERCHSLRQRLRSVLRDGDAKEADIGSAPRVMLVPLAEQIRGIGDMTVDAIRMLDDIGRNLEVPHFEPLEPAR